jgi:uncharacterized protein YdhG (YjbR/CyaY superfamily)
MSAPAKSQKPHYASIDAYIATFPEDIQTLLEAIRVTILTAVPAAEERISYNMPAFVLNGSCLFVAAWKKHIGMYPVPAGLPSLAYDASRYLDAKSTLKFPLNQPLPLELIHAIAQLSAAENLAKASSKRSNP